MNDLLNRDLDVLVGELLTPFHQATVLRDDVTITEPAPKTGTTTNVLGDPLNLSTASITFRMPVDGDLLLLTYSRTAARH